MTWLNICCVTCQLTTYSNIFYIKRLGGTCQFMTAIGQKWIIFKWITFKALRSSDNYTTPQKHKRLMYFVLQAEAEIFPLLWAYNMWSWDSPYLWKYFALSPLIIGCLLAEKCFFLMVLEICREPVPNLSGSADQWWQRGDSFMHVPLAQRQLCVLACRLHGPGSRQAMAWHWATDRGLRTPATEQNPKIWNKINAFITIANQASKFYQSDKSPM